MNDASTAPTPRMAASGERDSARRADAMTVDGGGEDAFLFKTCPEDEVGKVELASPY